MGQSLLGISLAAATGLLATFAAGEADAVESKISADQDSSRGRLGDDLGPVPHESITFAGPRVPLMAAWAAAARPGGGVLVIHENRGLTEHIRTVAGRLAASGYF